MAPRQDPVSTAQSGSAGPGEGTGLVLRLLRSFTKSRHGLRAMPGCQQPSPIWPWLQPLLTHSETGLLPCVLASCTKGSAWDVGTWP